MRQFASTTGWSDRTRNDAGFQSSIARYGRSLAEALSPKASQLQGRSKFQRTATHQAPLDGFHSRIETTQKSLRRIAQIYGLHHPGLPGLSRFKTSNESSSKKTKFARAWSFLSIATSNMSPHSREIRPFQSAPLRRFSKLDLAW